MRIRTNPVSLCLTCASCKQAPGRRGSLSQRSLLGGAWSASELLQFDCCQVLPKCKRAPQSISNYSNYSNHPIIRTIQLFEHPCFQEKWLNIAFQAFNYSNHPIIQTIQLFEHPCFQEKWLNIAFQAFKYPSLKLLSNTYTLRSLIGGRQTSTRLRQPLRNSNWVCRMSTSLRQSLRS